MHEKDRKYNGWSNYETWNFKLWLDNDEVQLQKDSKNLLRLVIKMQERWLLIYEN
jgi:hypothetical protein